MGDYSRSERKKEFARIKAAVESAPDLETVKKAMVEFMDMFYMHTHATPVEMTECGSSPGPDTDPPMGW